MGAKLKVSTLVSLSMGRHDTQHNDIHHNDTQQDIQHNDNKNETLSIKILSVMAERCCAVSFMLSVTYAECHYAKCYRSWHRLWGPYVDGDEVV